MDENKIVNRMIGTIMKETGYNYQFLNLLSPEQFLDLYAKCVYQDREKVLINSKYEQLKKDYNRLKKSEEVKSELRNLGVLSND